MGAFREIFHFTDENVHSLCSFISAIEPENRHSIPLGKILFTLFRKKYLRTVLTETNPKNPQYVAECKLSGGNSAVLIRYHFFNEENENHLTSETYGGYCDIRPDATIVDAFITLFTITGGKKDSYVFVPCRMEQSVDVPLPDGGLLAATVTGFPYMEKNHKETMCAQAALLGAVKYWKSKFPGSFSEVETAIDINRLAGVCEDRKGGLSAPEMTQFFHAVGQDVKFCDYSFKLFDEEGRKHLLTDVYSFIESGCPVIAGVKTYSAGHALTFIGHTFDKNSWSAMADLGYYGKKNEFWAYPHF